VKIHPHCGVSLSKTDLVLFGTELEVMEQNRFLGGDSPDIEFLNEQKAGVHGQFLRPASMQFCLRSSAPKLNKFAPGQKPVVHTKGAWIQAEKIKIQSPHVARHGK
jgi:hypothetical protein